MIIKQLVTDPSNAELLLAQYRGCSGYANISNGDWDTSLAVIQGINFEMSELVDRTILPNFVDCNFKNSRFVQLKSDGHFWGAGNRWSKCLFAGSLLKNMISPFNAFEDCDFDAVRVEGYQPCDTIFTSCRFTFVEIHSLSAILNPQRKEPSPPALQFIGCEFRRPTFVTCAFKYVSFQDCTFLDPDVKDCDFSGVVADTQWWPKEQDKDLFVVFLNEVVAVLRQRLGDKSKSVEILQRYLQTYLEGGNQDKDYSAGLYSGIVPDNELVVVEEILDDIAPRFGRF